MSRKTQETVILGRDANGDDADIRYTCTPMDGMDGAELFAKVSTLIAPSLGILADGADSLDDLVSGNATGMLGQAIQALATRIHEKDVKAAILQLLQGVTRFGPNEHGQPLKEELKNIAMVNSAYAANYAEMGRAIRWSAEVNYPSFFGGGRIGRALDKAKEMASQLASKTSGNESSPPSTQDSPPSSPAGS